MTRWNQFTRLIRTHRRTATLAAVLATALGFRIAAGQMFFSRPAVSLSMLMGTAQLSAERSGINLILIQNRGDLSLRLDRITNYARNGYHYGWRLRFLGVDGAIQPYSFRDIDVEINAHAGLLLPYWLLMTAPFVLLVRSSSWWKVLRAHSLPRGAWLCGGAVLALFLVLNFIPDAGRPGAHIDPEGLWEHLLLVFSPGSLANEVHLQYGWPSRCFECALVQGSLVDEYYGYALGWKQASLGENLALATLASIGSAAVFGWMWIMIANSNQTSAPVDDGTTA